jgi:serine/threonine-protein kinase
VSPGADDTVFVCELNACVVYAVSDGGASVTVFAGLGLYYNPCGDAGGITDGVAANTVNLGSPTAVAATTDTVFVADSTKLRIFAVDRSTGLITTVVGTGTATYTGSGQPVSALSLDVTPAAIAVEPASGDLMVADAVNGYIWRVHAGTASVLAGERL